MKENTLRERLIADIGAIRAESAKTRLWDSDERIADYLLSKGWTLPARCDVCNGETYHKTCPFCKTEHEQRAWLNIICPCGAKYYFREKYWLDRKTGERKL